ncbi:hypothetical protein TNCT_509841 [Trichonephila clavata]|uniref:Uncharacterized protein n=1 Tax=Trichonephila clavata TaxID=2740835 RepID=A0A8X6GD86_TRICU|nr:hypothetical protein TNCT_509841 [Trichonephila clavata]
MANRINLSHADIAKLIEASDSEEEVSEYENHTSDETESESSNNNLKTNNRQMNSNESIRSKNLEIRGKLIPMSYSFQSMAANIINSTPRVTRCAKIRITDLKNAFDVLFNSTIENVNHKND